MKWSAALTLFILLVVSGSSAAFTTSTGWVAKTRSDKVEWTSNVTLETNSLVVKANSIVIGDQNIDFKPDGLQGVRVYFTRWGIDRKDFVVVMTAGAQTGLNITYSNSGSDLKIHQNGEVTHTCDKAITPCSWVLTNASKFNFSITTPAGSQAIQNEQSPPPPASAGGGGSSGGGGGAPVPEAPKTLADLPNPVDRFPHLTPLQWLVVLTSTFLILNGFPQTQAVLPAFLRFNARRDFLLLAGTLGLVLLWLTPT